MTGQVRRGGPSTRVRARAEEARRSGAQAATAVARWPVRWWRERPTDVLQVLKSVLATVVAWLVATRVLRLDQAFLAPWAALLTVHATVYRSVWRGAQAIAATAVGLLVAAASVTLLGAGWPALGLAVLVGLVVSRVPPLNGEEGVAAATTAVFVITLGAASDEVALAQRLLDTAVGIGTGLLVNLLVAPPLDDRVAERALRRATGRVGALLVTMAGDLRADLGPEVPDRWLEECRHIDADLRRARDDLSFARESHWANPRQRSVRTSDVAGGDQVLGRLVEAVGGVRAIARVVRTSVEAEEEWDEEFTRRWTDVLRQVGDRTSDPDRRAGAALGELRRLVDDLSQADLPRWHWPVYGALLMATTTTASLIDDVTEWRAA